MLKTDLYSAIKSEDSEALNDDWRVVSLINNASALTSYLVLNLRHSGGFSHVQHVRPNSGPHKKGPHKRSGEFFACPKYRNHGQPRVNNESNKQKKVVSFSGELTADTHTVMSKKGRQFFFEVKGPTFFSEQDPTEGKSGPVKTQYTYFSALR